MASTTVKSRKTVLESAGFALRAEDGHPIDEWTLRDFELDLGVVANDLALLPELLSDACALRFGAVDYQFGYQSIDLYLDDVLLRARVDDGEEDATLLDGFRGVVSTINGHLAARSAAVRVYVVGFPEQSDQPADHVRVVSASPSWLDGVDARGTRILVGPPASMSPGEDAAAPRVLTSPRDAIAADQCLVFDSECVDHVEDYGRLINDLAALAETAIDLVDYREGARRHLLIRAAGRSVSIDLRGGTDYVDLPPLLAGLNELLPGPRYLHPVPEFERGQELAVGFFDESDLVRTARRTP